MKFILNLNSQQNKLLMIELEDEKKKKIKDEEMVIKLLVDHSQGDQSVSVLGDLNALSDDCCKNFLFTENNSGMILALQNFLEANEVRSNYSLKYKFYGGFQKKFSTNR